jgi:endothelin-converting enzyme/putative endopeptidase
MGVVGPDDPLAYEPDSTTLPSAFVDAQSALRRRARSQSLGLIGQPDPRFWDLPPIAVNATYSWTLNAINLPAAILQRPFFDSTFPDVVTYGAIGAVIGHELTHGFDDEGRQFDASGALSDWWSSQAKAAFDSRAQCLVAQYGAIEGAPGIPIDGQLTLGENIADLAGAKLAYAALGPTGARMGDFSDAQLFFVAYAQRWCTSIRPEALATDLRTDPHSPPKARVNAVLADLPEFARAFQCPADAPLAPSQPCAVW